MVFEQQRIVVGDERKHSVAESGCAGEPVGGKWDSAELNHDFGKQRLVEGAAGGSESGGDGRMGVDYGAHVRTQTVDGHMHGDFAGALAIAGNLISREITQNDVIE